MTAREVREAAERVVQIWSDPGALLPLDHAGFRSRLQIAWPAMARAVDILANLDRAQRRAQTLPDWPEVEQRRLRAAEAFYDEMMPGDSVRSRALEEALETATRVRVTPEMAMAAMDGWREPDRAWSPITVEEVWTQVAEAVLRAAGFEVEE